MNSYPREPNRNSSGLVSLRYGDTAESQVLKEDGLFEDVQGALPSVSNESLEARLRRNSRVVNETAAPTYVAKPKAAFQPSTKTEQQLLAEDDSEDSDGFNEEEQEELTRTAAEFAKKLRQIEAIQTSIFEGGEDTRSPTKQKSKNQAEIDSEFERIERSITKQNSGAPNKPRDPQLINNDSISLKSPSMIAKREPRTIGASGYAPSQGSLEKNPFQFIEAALVEAKQKIEKMKATPQILESLNDVSQPLNNY